MPRVVRSQMPRGTDGLRARQAHRQDQRRREQEAKDGAGEEAVEADHGQQRGSEHRADQALEVVGEPRQRQRAGVVALVGQHVGDRRLEGRREPGRRRLQQEDQQVDLPHLGHERQRQRHDRADEIECDQHRAAGKPFGEGRRDRSDTDIGDHLDRQRRAEHRAGPVAREIEGEQSERDRGEPRPHQRDDLGEKQVPIGAVREDAEHARRLRGISRSP